MELRQSLPTVRSRHSDHSKRSLDVKISSEFDSSSASISNGHHKSRNKQKHQGFPLTRSTASLDCKQTQVQPQLQRRRPPRVDLAMEHLSKTCRKNSSQVQPLDFDSEPTYYRLQVIFFSSTNFCLNHDWVVLQFFVVLRRVSRERQKILIYQQSTVLKNRNLVQRHRKSRFDCRYIERPAFSP